MMGMEKQIQHQMKQEILMIKTLNKMAKTIVQALLILTLIRHFQTKIRTLSKMRNSSYSQMLPIKTILTI